MRSWRKKRDKLRKYAEYQDMTVASEFSLKADPLPDCQHDAFLPIRVKGRDIGKPQWGQFEILKDGQWVDCDFSTGGFYE